MTRPSIYTLVALTLAIVAVSGALNGYLAWRLLGHRLECSPPSETPETGEEGTSGPDPTAG